MSEPIIVQHPLIQDKLTHMRDKNTDSGMFRTLANEISELLGYEATRNLQTYEQEIQSASGTTVKFPMVKSKGIAIVSILRAGNGMLDGMLRLIPSAQVGHIGLYRDPKSFTVIEYYFKVPENMQQKDVFVIDPMIATGHSACAAVNRIKETMPKSITFICLVASPEGVAYLQSNHSDITIFTAAVDNGLDTRNYIVPGLGDAGDRMFGTQ